MPTTVVEIARSGEIRWEAASEVAGPYYLSADSLSIATVVGGRGAFVEKPGSASQVQAFLASRAAFHALRNSEIGKMRGNVLVKGKTTPLRRYACQLAAKIARAELEKWPPDYAMDATAINTYEAFVDARFEGEWSKVEIIEGACVVD